MGRIQRESGAWERGEGELEAEEIKPTKYVSFQGGHFLDLA